jgi:hypothetical protein
MDRSVHTLTAYTSDGLERIRSETIHADVFKLPHWFKAVRRF